MDDNVLKKIATKSKEISPYYHDASGALWCVKDEKKKLVSEVFIKVVGLSRGIDGTSWSTVIEFMNLDNKLKNIQIPSKTLLDSKETFRLLVDSGFKASCCGASLIRYLQDAQPEKRLIQLARSGWIANGLEYICPSFQITDGSEEYVLSSADSVGFAQSSTLEEWQKHVCQYCVGNPVLTLALCVGLSGMLLRFLPNISSTMVNLVGKSSIGKTTVLQAAASLWGDSKFIKQWRCTSNALEGIAEERNDGLLILDELGQVHGKEVSNIAYMLGNEQGKSRMNSDATLRKARSWRVSVLSSGEISIADKIEEAGMKAKGGQLVRCLDIDVCVSELGIYNSLHGAKDGADLSNILKANCAKCYGTAAEEFIRRFVDNISYENLSDSIKDELDIEEKRITNKFQLEDADGQVKRATMIFALYAASGIYASRLDIFTHTDEEIRSDIDSMFERWIKDRGGKGSFEEQNILEKLQGFILQNGSRFEDLNSLGEKAVNNRLGYKVQQKERTLYHVIPELFRKEFCTSYMGISFKTIRKELIRKKVLLLYEDGRDIYVQLHDGHRLRMTTVTFSDI